MSIERGSYGRTRAPFLFVLLLSLAACGQSGDGPEPAATDETAESDPSSGSETTDATGPVDSEATEEDAEDAGDTESEEESAGEDGLLFVPADQPPAPRGEAAPGVIVVTSAWSESPRYWRIILTVGADGEVVENWRFDLSTATAADDPAVSHRGEFPEDFSSDFRWVAATGDYDVEDGPFDRHAGYVTPDGEFVSVAGRQIGESLTQDAEVRFGPDDRLWYWRGSDEDVRRTDLVSVGPDGTDHRHEVEFEERLASGRPYGFSLGANSQPYLPHEHAVYAASDDGTVAVFRGRDAQGRITPLVIGNPEDWATAEQYEGEFGGEVWQFLPGSNDEIVVYGPDGVGIATLDHGNRTVTHEAVELDGVSSDGTFTGIAVGRDGTIAYSHTDRDSREGEDVAVITVITPDRSAATVTRLRSAPDVLPTTRVLGVTG